MGDLRFAGCGDDPGGGGGDSFGWREPGGTEVIGATLLLFMCSGDRRGNSTLRSSHGWPVSWHKSFAPPTTSSLISRYFRRRWWSGSVSPGSLQHRSVPKHWLRTVPDHLLQQALAAVLQSTGAHERGTRVCCGGLEQEHHCVQPPGAVPLARHRGQRLQHRGWSVSLWFDGRRWNVAEASTVHCGARVAFRRSRDSFCFGFTHFTGKTFYDASQFGRRIRAHSVPKWSSSWEQSAPSCENSFGTLFSVFRDELNERCNFLESRNCRHVRCLLPSVNQTPLMFYDNSMLHQCK